MKNQVRRLKPLVPIFLILFLVLQGWHFFTHLAVFKIKEVKIIGNEFVSQKNIEDSFQSPLGQSIFLFPKKEIQTQILKNKRIVQVVFNLKQINRLELRIIERVPFARTKIEDHYWVLDIDGEILNSDEHAGEYQSLVQIPEIVGLTSIREIKPLFAQLGPFLQNVLRFLKQERVSIFVADNLNFRMLLDNKVPVKLGEKNLLNEKAEVLEALFPTIVENFDKISYIDLRAPSSAVIKYR
jgi:cell division septal protein FtsQ